MKKNEISDKRKELYLNLELSHKKVAEKLNISEKTVYKWRKKHLKEETFSENFKTNKKITVEEMKIIKDLSLNNTEVAKMIGISNTFVAKKRSKIFTKEELEGRKFCKSTFKVINAERNRKGYKTSEIKEILNSNKCYKELAIIHGRTEKAIAKLVYKYKNKEI